MPSKPASSNIAEIVLNAHEERIRDLEQDFATMAKAILPLVAKIEENVERGFENIGHRLNEIKERIVSMEHRLATMESTIGSAALKQQLAEQKIVVLEKTEDERKKISTKLVFLMISTAVALGAGAVGMYLGIR